MRLARYRFNGEVRWGVVMNYTCVDLVDIVSDIPTTDRDIFDCLTQDPSLRNRIMEGALRIEDSGSETGHPTDQVVFLNPINQPRQVIPIECNSEAALAECPFDAVRRPYPSYYHVPDNVLAAPGSKVKLEPYMQTIMVWPELTAVVGTKIRAVSREKAMESILGFSLMNVFRDFSFASGVPAGDQIILGMANTFGRWADGFKPMGPWLLTADELPEPKSLILIQKLGNSLGKIQARVKDLFLSIDEVISNLSRYFTLFPGDIITLGQMSESLIISCHEKIQPQDSFVDTHSPNCEGLGSLRTTFRDSRRSSEVPKEHRVFVGMGNRIGKNV